MTIFNFKKFQENKQYVEFDESKIKYYKKLFSFLSSKHNTPYWNSMIQKMEQDKKLTKKQFEELDFLLKNGKSKYEAGVLSTKN
jgi:hypothetical protein